MHKEVIAVIPAYNEEFNIGEVVAGALKYVDRVIVVDDGSADRTAQIAEEHGAVVIRQSNQGVGAATRRGMVQALSDYPDLFSLVLLDGDGQHDPDDLVRLLNAAYTGSDIVIGNRDLKLKYMPFTRWLANWVFYIIRNVGASRVLKDAECGYRVFTRHALDEIDITIDHFGFAEEVAIKARALGLVIAEVPIRTIYGDDQLKYPFYKKVYHGVGIIISIIKWRWLYEWRLAFGTRSQLNASGRSIKPHSPETLLHPRSLDKHDDI